MIVINVTGPRGQLQPNVSQAISYEEVAEVVAQNKEEENILILLVEWPAWKFQHGRDTRRFEAAFKGQGLRMARVSLQDLKEACYLTSTPLTYSAR